MGFSVNFTPVSLSWIVFGCPSIHMQRRTQRFKNVRLIAVGPQAGQERTPARGYGPLIRSERRSRTHPVVLQEIYKGAHLRQKQAGAQG